MTENSKTENDLNYIPAKVVLLYSLWGGAVAGFWSGLVISPPLIFLTARNEEVDRIVGLELGADAT